MISITYKVISVNREHLRPENLKMVPFTYSKMKKLYMPFIDSELIYTIIEVSFKSGLTVCGRYDQRFE